ncbi:metallophosphoesterase family protein [Xylanimonas ulmi]|uniref:Calcineurin-like phosphoesterase family protein n=1 Tax=Xylanimonas ulmi TaxID=228973 RepID=A0A4Q7M6J7_9MICO|nr:metallophosphoesterase family protein [Xylanibacterium ulmi]RZS62262.1 calcineurin-like phosphoesterase family protein [Xylanibacterium ulmi]
MTTFYTADLHLGHANLLTLSAARGAQFAAVEQMDAALIERWNETVAPDDTVWVLGDVDMHGKPTNLAKVTQLHGTKILIAGNHDACWAGMRGGWAHRKAYLDAGFDAVLDFAVTTLPSTKKNAQHPRVMLSHFPYDGDHADTDRYEAFRLRDRGIPLLHGHVHEAYRERKSRRGTWGVNVGVDWWDYRPVHERTLAAHLDDLRRGPASR